MALRAGDLNQLVSLQIESGTPDGAGGTVRSWADISPTPQVWAQILPLNGGEAFARGVARSTQFYRVTIRYRADVGVLTRIVWKGQTLNVRTCADPDGSREALLITAESGVPDA